MKKTIFSVVVLIAVGSLLAADPPAKVPAPKADPAPAPVLVLNLQGAEQVSIGDMATVSIDPSSTAQGIVWSIDHLPSNADNWQPHAPSDPTHAAASDYSANLCNGTQPGTFTVIAAGNLNGQTVIAQQTITFGTPTPPTPPPTPNPPTPPVASKLSIVTLSDVGAMTEAESELLSDGAYWKAVVTAGHKYKQYDASDPNAAPWKKLLPAGAALPVIVFIDAATNKLLEVDELPATTAGVSALVTKLTGTSPTKAGK